MRRAWKRKKKSTKRVKKLEMMTRLSRGIVVAEDDSALMTIVNCYHLNKNSQGMTEEIEAMNILAGFGGLRVGLFSIASCSCDRAGSSPSGSNGISSCARDRM